MANEHVLELTDDNFEQEVIQSDRPVLVDFWAEWCQPCRMVAPTISEIADDYKDRIRVGKLDTDANTIVATRFDIRAIPTLLLFRKGRVVHKFVGMTPKPELTKEIEKAVA